MKFIDSLYRPFYCYPFRSMSRADAWREHRRTSAIRSSLLLVVLGGKRGFCCAGSGTFALQFPGVPFRSLCRLQNRMYVERLLLFLPFGDGGGDGG